MISFALLTSSGGNRGTRCFLGLLLWSPLSFALALSLPAAASRPSRRSRRTRRSGRCRRRSTAPLTKGPAYFVDAPRATTRTTAPKAKPWKTIQHGVQRLKPGDTLYLRGGIYYEKVCLTRSGTAGGADHHRLVSRRTGGARRRAARVLRIARDELGAVQGRRGGRVRLDQDLSRTPTTARCRTSSCPRRGSRCGASRTSGRSPWGTSPIRWCRCTATASSTDLRATNEFWLDGKKDADDRRLLRAGPVVQPRDGPHPHPARAPPARRAWATAPIAARPTRASCRWSSPSASATTCCASAASSTSGSQGLVLRGATGSPMIHVYGSENIDLDHLTVFGGFPALLVNASKNVRVTHSAFRGLAAPWTGRAHMKYRGTAVVSDRLAEQPAGEREHRVRLLRVHRRPRLRVPPLRQEPPVPSQLRGQLQRRRPGVRAEAARPHDVHPSEPHRRAASACSSSTRSTRTSRRSTTTPTSGVFVYRNVFDLRGRRLLSACRAKPDPTGAFLHDGGPSHQRPRRPDLPGDARLSQHVPAARRRSSATTSCSASARRACATPSATCSTTSSCRPTACPASVIRRQGSGRNLREGGNLLWGMKEGPTLQGRPVRQVPRVAAVQGEPQALRAGLDDARPRRRPEVREAPGRCERARPTCAWRRAARPSTPGSRSRRSGPTRCATPTRASRTSGPSRSARRPGASAWTAAFRSLAARRESDQKRPTQAVPAGLSGRTRNTPSIADQTCGAVLGATSRLCGSPLDLCLETGYTEIVS